MKNAMTLLLAGSLALSACGDDDTTVFPDASPTPDGMSSVDARPSDGGTTVTPVDITADIEGDTTWTADHTYTLKKHIFVRSGTLTIQPGVQIFGDEGSSLVITTNARLDAQGTAEAPIVFSSSKAVGSRAPGDWGGVVLLGLAPINVTGGSNQIEGFPAGTSGTTYGGTDPQHDCGILRYVRIEFAGYPLTQDNELNGLTLGGCGSSTLLDHVQVHKGKDDALEIFGGLPNVKHVVLSQMEDDGLDWDFGFVGKMQFVVIQQNNRGNQGIEADNNKDANDATPRSMPTIYNMTIVGSDAAPGGALDVQKGIHFRRGTAGHLYNVIVAHAADFPVDIDGTSSVNQANAGNLFLKNSIFFDNGNQTSWSDTNDGGFDEGSFFRNASQANLESDPSLMNALDPTAPSFAPASNSPALVPTNAATPPNDGFFDTAARFIGAVGSSDWTAGWTAFPQN